MKKSDFNFELPEHLIAQYPLSDRKASRLLVLQNTHIEHKIFKDIIDLIEPGDLLVFNNTKVIPARLFGRKASGGKVEVLIERVLNDKEIMAHVRASKAPPVGTHLIMDGGIEFTMLGRNDDLFHLRSINDGSVLDLIEQHGHLPLPPYIQRADTAVDKDRYQTVYAAEKGAVAAPTAGLHFDEMLLEQLRAKGVNFAFVTLHVGAGTFQPVRTDDIREHKMHSEYMTVSEQVCDQVKQTKAAGKRVIAVGTTSVRCLETASQSGEIRAYRGDTQIFIYPGYEFKCIDALITNFHLPESTLLMLVSALVGREAILNAYQVAVEQEYRFFSYGDAMFLTKK